MEMEEAAGGSGDVGEGAGKGRGRMRILDLVFAMVEIQQPKTEPGKKKMSTKAKRGAKRKCKEGLITCCCGSIGRARAHGERERIERVSSCFFEIS